MLAEPACLIANVGLGRGSQFDAVGHEASGRLNSRRISPNASSSG
jgi:hypothetical protein